MRGNGGIIGAMATSTTKTGPGMWGINEASRRLRTNYADLQQTWPLLSDASFSNVIALCHFDELTAASGTFYKDKSNLASDLSQQSLAGQVLGGLSNVQTKFAATSLLVNGQRRGTKATGITNFGTGDFTVELWFYQLTQSSAQVLVDMSTADGNTSSPLMEVSAGNKVTFFHNPQTAVNITGGTTVTANAWHHFHATRASGTTYLGMDGVQEGSDFTDSNNYSNSTYYVGQLTDTNTGLQAFLGYIAEFRVSTIARYTRTYTVPTARFPDY